MIKYLQELRNGCAIELLKAVRERVFDILLMESINEDNFMGRGGWRYLWMRHGRDEAGVRVKCRTLLPEVRVECRTLLPNNIYKNQLKIFLPNNIHEISLKYFYPIIYTKLA